MSTKTRLVIMWIGGLLMGFSVGALVQRHIDRDKTSLTAQEADRIYAEGFAWGEAEGRANK